VVFVADDLGAWLVGLLADAGRKKLTALVLGSDQERAVRKAATAAVQDTAAEMNLSVDQAERLSKVFRKLVPDARLAGSVTMLEALQAGIARQLAVLDADRTGAGQSSAEVLGAPGDVLVEKLSDHLVREIMLRGSDGGPLTPLANQLNHDLTHLQGQRIEDMLARLVALGITAPAPSADAGGPARDVGPATGAVQVSEADPRRLGVHAAISVPGAPEEVPPEYVPRDVDTAEHGIRARVAAAAQRGGFVLLVGGSSVGKTRCAVETVRALLPDWWLVHPAGPGQVAALAAAPVPRLVVWLDELQRYLNGEHGLTGAVVRELLNAPSPAVIIATLWPEFYTAYTSLPAAKGPDPHAREREVLDLADVVRIGPEFSPAEQGRARAAAARDPRLRVALASAGYGLTQTLAAAPQLVARWEDAQTARPYAWAVLTAALDAARLGARAPLSADFLRAAAPGYCTSQQQAEAPDNWFEQALAYATGKLHGAVAALSPAAAGMGRVAGYTVADYLIQTASRERRPARVPAGTWDAALSFIRDSADAFRLGDSARDRLLYSYAIPLYRHAADAGDENAARRLPRLLAKRGDYDGAAQILRARADAGDREATWDLADLLAERGDLDGLRARADAGDYWAGSRLARLLAERGDLDQLRARADARDEAAAERLADLLAKRGDYDGAAPVLRDLDELRARADARDEKAAWRLAGLLAERGDLDQLRARADAGDEMAALQLAGLLAERGDYDGAAPVLRASPAIGYWWAASRLADLLAKRGDYDGAAQILRAPADAGDERAAERLADLLAERGDLDQLRTRADARDQKAAERLAGLLAERGDLDQLRTRADARDVWAGDRDPWAAGRLADLLAERGDLDQLRARADARDYWAAERLADLLAKRGDLDQLRARADAGDEAAAERLAGLLAERGDLDQLRARADAGEEKAAWRLADLLAERGDLDQLRARADARDYRAEERLAGLLIKQGRGEEAERLRRFGLHPDGSIASA
jgi:hypothetical protein